MDIMVHGKEVGQHKNVDSPGCVWRDDKEILDEPSLVGVGAQARCELAGVVGADGAKPVCAIPELWHLVGGQGKEWVDDEVDPLIIVPLI